MIGLTTLSALFTNLINTNIVDKVYHSVLIKQDGEHKKPAAPVKGRFQYVGVDDTKGFTAYCRAVGPVETEKSESMGSCSSIQRYRTQTLHRLVFFNQDEDRAPDDLSGRLLQAVMMTPKIKFKRLITNPGDILASEAPTGQFKFLPSTFYIAIEFLVVLDITTDTCQTEIKCKEVANPFC